MWAPKKEREPFRTTEACVRATFEPLQDWWDVVLHEIARLVTQDLVQPHPHSPKWRPTDDSMFMWVHPFVDAWRKKPYAEARIVRPIGKIPLDTLTSGKRVMRVRVATEIADDETFLMFVEFALALERAIDTRVGQLRNYVQRGAEPCHGIHVLLDAYITDRYMKENQRARVYLPTSLYMTKFHARDVTRNCIGWIKSVYF